MKLLLIDADSIIYRAGFSTEYVLIELTKDGRSIETKSRRDMKQAEASGWEVTDMVEVVEPLGNAIHIVQSILDGILEPWDGKYKVYLSDSPTWRDIIYPDYKANRTAPKPEHYYDLFKYIQNAYGAEVVPNVEADDLISYDALQDGVEPVIAGIDKDLQQIPGTHFNYVNRETIVVDPITAEYNFYVQLLTGDTADNIKGLYKVGPKAAEKILADCDTDVDMYWACVEEYCKRGVPWDQLLLNGRLLRLWDKNRQVWEPPE